LFSGAVIGHNVELASRDDLLV